MDLKVNIKGEITKPVEDLTKTLVRVGDFLGRVFGPGVESAGGLFQDQITSWRASNLLRLSDKWEQKRRGRNLPPDIIKRLPFDLGARLIPAAAIEDDDDVLDMWSSLLDAATDPERCQFVKRLHIDLLQSMTGLDALVLQLLSRREVEDDKECDDNVAIELASRMARHPLDDQRTALQNLERQRCVRPRFDYEALNQIRQSVDEIGLRMENGSFLIRELSSIISTFVDLQRSHSPVGEAERLGRFDKTNTQWSFEDYYELTDLGWSLARVCIKNMPGDR